VLRLVARFFGWILFLLAGLLLGMAFVTSHVLLKWLSLVAGGLFTGLWLLWVYWSLRPNRARIAPALQIETWPAVADGLHNSNTDLIYWKDSFYLIHAAAPFHFASRDCRLVLRKSVDGHSMDDRTWQEVARFAVPGEDIRDPKLAIIGGRLYLYALKNTAFNPEPYTTVFTSSQDGITWSAFQEIDPKGWLFWRPKSRDGANWYVTAYWWEHGRAALLHSTDGEHWTIHANIHEDDRTDETDFEFLPDGSMIATARLEMSESIFGHPQGSTLVATAKAPYTDWELCTRSPVTRLDGPNLFAYLGQVYAVGRFQPLTGGPFTWQGSAFCRKRTALFRVSQAGLVYLSDLPSAGDTSYAGVVVRDDELWTCYYSSDIRRDYAWIMGMMRPTDIVMARINMASLERLGQQV
jgi:hypothetical protein